MKNTYVFNFASEIYKDNQVRIEMTAARNSGVPYLSGRFQMPAEEWGIFEAMLMYSPRRFLDDNVKVNITNGPGVIEAIDLTMPGKRNP